MNGKPGDHPLQDILDHRLSVFAEPIDGLIRAIAEYMSRDRLYEMLALVQAAAAARVRGSASPRARRAAGRRQGARVGAQVLTAIGIAVRSPSDPLP
jgi:hypothetical protein